MKVLSKASIYGLRALLYIASRKNQVDYVSIREMSEELGISFHFLTKILQSLTQQKLLESYKGPTGGITLARPASEIYLAEIVRIIDGVDFFDTCLLGLPGCGSEKPCPVHEFWKVTKAALQHEFETTSLASLGKQVSKGTTRLVG